MMAICCGTGFQPVPGCASRAARHGLKTRATQDRDRAMAVYAYKASDLTSGDTTGTIAADTPRQARDLLRDRGLIIRDLSDVRVRSEKKSRLFRAASSYHVT